MARFIKRIAPSESSFIAAGQVLCRYLQSVILVNNELFVSKKVVLDVKALRNQSRANTMVVFQICIFKSVNSGLIDDL